MQVKKFKDVKPGDVLVFSGSEYKVRSVIVRRDRVDVVFHDTNEGGAYIFDHDEEIDVA